MQPSTAVINNNCYAHWRPQTSVMFLHWHPALRWRLFSRVVNPGNPAISRHVVRRKPPIALENKNCRRKGTKYQGKVNFFLVHVKKYLASQDKLILVLETLKFCYICKIIGTVSCYAQFAWCARAVVYICTSVKCAVLQWILLHHFIRLPGRF